MPTLKDVLSASMVERLAAIADEAVAEAQEHEADYDPRGYLTQAGGLLVPEGDRVRTTEINGVLYDLRSEGMCRTECVDCRCPLEVEVVPQGADLDLLTSTPRVAACAPCAQARTQGKRGSVIHRPRVQRHQPRTSDHQDHPVLVTTPKENDMPEFDLSHYGPAQLAELFLLVQERLRAQAAEALPAKVATAIAEAEAHESADQAVRVEQREARKGWVLDGFTLHTVEVPTLDLSEVANMDEAVSATVRSPYNKALYRNGEPLLSTSTNPAEGQVTTWAVVAAVHERLAAVAAAGPVAATPAPAEVKAGVKAEPTLVAVVDPDKRAKQVAVLMAVRGVTEQQAIDILAAL